MFPPSMLLTLVGVSSSSGDGPLGGGGSGDLCGGEVFGGSPVDAPLQTATDFFVLVKIVRGAVFGEQRWC